MRSKYESIRFFLFCNSYSGETIASFLRKRYKNKKLLKVVKRLSQILNFSCERLESFVLQETKPTCPYQRVPSDLKIYLEIEKELIILIEEKLDEYSTAKEDYQRQLLFPAFERAAGNSLGKIKDDYEFSIKLGVRINEYGNIYYKVAYKYKLPTIRIVPFLLRLIN